MRVRKNKSNLTIKEIVCNIEEYINSIDETLRVTDDILFWEERKQKAKEIIMLLLLNDTKREVSNGM